MKKLSEMSSTELVEEVEKFVAPVDAECELLWLAVKFELHTRLTAFEMTGLKV